MHPKTLKAAHDRQFNTGAVLEPNAEDLCRSQYAITTSLCEIQTKVETITIARGVFALLMIP